LVHWQVPPVHWKLALAAPFGQPQLTVVQLFVTLPQALPRAGVGQLAGAQQTFGFAVVLQAMPPAQGQLSVPPQPLSYVPHASLPFVGTLAQV
jgi:hypothetical protein